MWETIKRILSKEGGKCIVIEDKNSVYLIKKLKPGTDMEEEKTEEVNRDIDQWKAEEKEEIPAFEDKAEEVEIEDLPL